MVSRSNLLRAVAPAVVALITLPGSIALASPDDSTPTTSTPDTVETPPTSTDPPTTTTDPPTTTVAPPSGTTSTTVPRTTSTTTTIAEPTTTTEVTIPPTSGTTTTTVPEVPEEPEGPREIVVRPDDIEYVLLTIRWMESRETYDIPPNKGGASGAYQYIKQTWANYAGYPEAYLAPPWVQDERAAADVAAILRRYNNDVSVVPIIWYYPAALTNPELMDIVPKPEAGNVLTIREYQWRWLDTLAYFMGGPLPPRLYALPPGLELLSGIPPVIPAPAYGQSSLAFPLLGPAAVAPPPPCDGDACDEPNPAIVYGRKLQPVLAAADGVVTSVVYEDASTGRVELTITDTAGTSYHYAGFNDDNPGTDDGDAPPALRLTALARVGGAVRAGQVIGFLGDSDREPIITTIAPATDITVDTDPSTSDPTSDTKAPELVNEPVWPHLRLTITALDGTPVDADGPVVQALFRQTCTVGIGPWSVPPNPAVFDGPIGITDVPAGDLAGNWTITASGQVQATGLAALVYPTPGCLWSPPDPFGPYAGGNTVLPLGFTDHIGLSADVWIAITLGAAGVRPAESLLLRGP
jgi:hypothetical protein